VTRLALVLLAGCWTGAVPAEATTPAPPTALRPVATSPYAAVAGEWTGIGLQYDNQSDWPFEMTLRSDAAIGQVVGTIVYPSLQCTSELVREPEERGTLVMTERLTSGVGLCVDAGKVRIPHRPKLGKLDWRWYLQDGTEGAKSLMTRVR
jgi:hypothetical protein